MWTRLEVHLAIGCCCGYERSTNYSTTVKVLVVLKVTQVRCEISLNRKHSSKIFMHPNMLVLEWEKLVLGIKALSLLTIVGTERSDQPEFMDGTWFCHTISGPPIPSVAL